MNAFKIRTDSLSYRFNKRLVMRFVDFMDGPYRVPSDFCTYWRHTLLWSPLILLFYCLVLMLFLSLGIGAAINIVPVLAVVGAGTIITFTVLGYEKFIHDKFPIATYIGKGFVWLWMHGPYQVLHFIFVTCIGGAFKFIFTRLGDGMIWLADHLPKGKTRPARLEKQPGWISRHLSSIGSFLVMRYISWKDNWCPMIEYVEVEVV